MKKLNLMLIAIGSMLFHGHGIASQGNTFNTNAWMQQNQQNPYSGQQYYSNQLASVPAYQQQQQYTMQGTGLYPNLQPASAPVATYNTPYYQQNQQPVTNYQQQKPLPQVTLAPKQTSQENFQIPIEDPTVLRNVSDLLEVMTQAVNTKNVSYFNAANTNLSEVMKNSRNRDLRSAYNNFADFINNNTTMSTNYIREINALQGLVYTLNEGIIPYGTTNQQSIPAYHGEIANPSWYYSARYALQSPFSSAWDWTKGTFSSAYQMGSDVWNAGKGKVNELREWSNPSQAKINQIDQEIQLKKSNPQYKALQLKVGRGLLLNETEQNLLNSMEIEIYALEKQKESWSSVLKKAALIGGAALAAKYYMQSGSSAPAAQ